MYNHHFSNFGRPLIPDDLCKDSAPRHPLFWRRRFFKGFYHIWAWRLSWSMDCDHFSILSFPQNTEAPHEIWATLAQRLQKRSRLKMLINGRTHRSTDGRQTKSDHNSSSWAQLRWAKKTCKNIKKKEDELDRAVHGTPSQISMLTPLSREKWKIMLLSHTLTGWGSHVANSAQWFRRR